MHRRAMDFANKARMADALGDDDNYMPLTRRAFECESEAAALLRHDPAHQMHAILHRSAAALAFRCGEYRAAESLIAHGLAGDPNPRLREQLTELRADVRQRLAQSNGGESAVLDDKASARERVSAERVPAGK